jgi:sRNA-binding carbon storage regulator CsrA
MFIHRVRLGQSTAVEGQIEVGDITIRFMRDRTRGGDVMIGIDAPKDMEIRLSDTIQHGPPEATTETLLPKPPQS